MTHPRFAALVFGCAALLIASAVQAQVLRPSQSVYLQLRGAVAGYTGDLDRNPGDSPFDITDGFADPGWGVGGELGYLFSERFSFGLGGWYQDFPALNVVAGNTNNVEGGEAYQIQGLFRYLLAPGWRAAPFLEFGGALVSGQGTENERNGGAANEDVWGYGPVFGLGVDIALTPQFSLFLGAQSTMVFPDVALDGADPSAFGDPNDRDAFDLITNLGGGLAFAFRSPVRAPEIGVLDCPNELEPGAVGVFEVRSDDEAATVVWEWGDGTTGTGAIAQHAFDAPGSYTVTATAENAGGRDSESCLVSVVDQGEPPQLAGCRATPVDVAVGEMVTIDATAQDASEVNVDFGDGTERSTLPARHAYSEAGTYTIEISAFNDRGADSCLVTVTVGDAFCQSVSELSAVSFDYGATTLSVEAMSRLDETIELLRRCPDICVTIYGYSDGQEPGGALRVSQARADAVLAYYAAQGIDVSRLRAVGQGVDPAADPKEDPGPGARLSRRVDSIPTSCAGF